MGTGDEHEVKPVGAFVPMLPDSGSKIRRSEASIKQDGVFAGLRNSRSSVKRSLYQTTDHFLVPWTRFRTFGQGCFCFR